MSRAVGTAAGTVAAVDRRLFPFDAAPWEVGASLRFVCGAGVGVGRLDGASAGLPAGQRTCGTAVASPARCAPSIAVRLSASELADAVW